MLFWYCSAHLSVGVRQNKFVMKRKIKNYWFNKNINVLTLRIEVDDVKLKFPYQLFSTFAFYKDTHLCYHYSGGQTRAVILLIFFFLYYYINNLGQQLDTGLQQKDTRKLNSPPSRTGRQQPDLSCKWIPGWTTWHTHSWTSSGLYNHWYLCSLAKQKYFVIKNVMLFSISCKSLNTWLWQQLFTNFSCLLWTQWKCKASCFL